MYPELPVIPPERPDQDEINRYFYEHCGFKFLDSVDDETEE